MKTFLHKLHEYRYIILGVCIGLSMGFFPSPLLSQELSNYILLSNVLSITSILGVIFYLIVKFTQVIESKINQFERHLLSEIKYLIERNK
jgi:hypothetical protein